MINTTINIGYIVYSPNVEECVVDVKNTSNFPEFPCYPGKDAFILIGALKFWGVAFNWVPVDFTTTTDMEMLANNITDISVNMSPIGDATVIANIQPLSAAIDPLVFYSFPEPSYMPSFMSMAPIETVVAAVISTLLLFGFTVALKLFGSRTTSYKNYSVLDFMSDEWMTVLGALYGSLLSIYLSKQAPVSFPFHDPESGVSCAVSGRCHFFLEHYMLENKALDYTFCKGKRKIHCRRFAEIISTKHSFTPSMSTEAAAQIGDMMKNMHENTALSPIFIDYESRLPIFGCAFSKIGLKQIPFKHENYVEYGFLYNRVMLNSKLGKPGIAELFYESSPADLYLSETRNVSYLGDKKCSESENKSLISDEYNGKKLTPFNLVNLPEPFMLMDLAWIFGTILLIGEVCYQRFKRRQSVAAELSNTDLTNECLQREFEQFQDDIQSYFQTRKTYFSDSEVFEYISSSVHVIGSSL